MTILEAIATADVAAQNDIEQDQKVKWLSNLDGQICDTILNKHDGTETEFHPYDETTDQETTQLLVPPPYDELYVDYLVMRFHLYQMEIERYNNAALVYAESLRKFAAYINKHYMPKGLKALAF